MTACCRLLSVVVLLCRVVVVMVVDCSRNGREGRMVGKEGGISNVGARVKFTVN
jgi:hypothetical protein